MVSCAIPWALYSIVSSSFPDCHSCTQYWWALLEALSSIKVFGLHQIVYHDQLEMMQAQIPGPLHHDMYLEEPPYLVLGWLPIPCTKIRWEVSSPRHLHPFRLGIEALVISKLCFQKISVTTKEGKEQLSHLTEYGSWAKGYDVWDFGFIGWHSSNVLSPWVWASGI